MMKVQTILGPCVGVGIDYDFLREVEIYVTDMNTVPVSISQDSGKS